MRLVLVLAALSVTIAACTPEPDPKSAQRIPPSLSLKELGEMDWGDVVATRYSLSVEGRSRQGRNAVGVSVVLQNLTNERVMNPICYLFMSERSIQLIEFEEPKEIAPRDFVRFTGVAHFPRKLRGESENIVCRPRGDSEVSAPY